MTKATLRKHDGDMPRAGHDRDEKQVAIVILPNFTLLSLGCIVDALRMANRVADRTVYGWRVIGLETVVVASSAVNVLVDFGIAEVQAMQADIVIVCGGIDGHLHNDRRLRSWLRDLDHRGAIIGAVSTGVWALARAGLLDGKRCAVHWDDVSSFAASFSLVDVRPDIFVHDGRRLTCSGGVAVIDMILHIAALHHGTAFADDIADLLIHGRVRMADEKQRKSERGEAVGLGAVRRAVLLMERHVEATLSIQDVARAVGRSPRQLERMFAKTFNVSPKQYYSVIRLKQARKLLTETEIPLTEIAMRCGYMSHSRFSLQFKKMFAKAPLKYRLEHHQGPLGSRMPAG